VGWSAGAIQIDVDPAVEYFMVAEGTTALTPKHFGDEENNYRTNQSAAEQEVEK